MCRRHHSFMIVDKCSSFDQKDSDVFKASSPCIERIGTTAPSDIKVLHSPPPSQQYTNCKENVDGIHSPSTNMAFCQDDAAEVGILRRKQKRPTIAAFQPKDVNWIPAPLPSSPALVVVSTTPVLPRPRLSAMQHGHVSVSRIFKPGDSEYRNKSLYASPLNGARARIRAWI
ncbi:uncharacterized protein BJ212DRAFT_676276 [Suillus subaureus]|uniref:Uncharacterized protein n=1 Tax=Suillus subaureus TaxID=48587 RepID=A0A9P7JHW2_9AGAM|nr:uncharacterized protein BJ212DRAFT_676276 [Suillus subaureus]KAG1823379.1 hypothetical protein BJ212DRAFT_676276 [Suillus subaureus]